jgi:hypothetical protein
MWFLKVWLKFNFLNCSFFILMSLYGGSILFDGSPILSFFFLFFFFLFFLCKKKKCKSIRDGLLSSLYKLKYSHPFHIFILSVFSICDFRHYHNRICAIQ